MSLPNLPEITPIEGLDAEQTALLLLASIASEEISIAHILNAEGEKIQAALGTLELPDGNILGPFVEDLPGLLDINTNINRTLRTLVKKEMLLQFKLEDTLDFIGTLPPGPTPEILCACQVQATLEDTTEVTINDTQVADADVTLDVNICPDCTPEGSEITLTVEALALPLVNFTAEEFTSIVCENDNLLTAEGTGTVTGLITGLVDFVITLDETEGTATIELTQNGDIVFVTTLDAVFNIEPCPEG
ncbi:hypothetical protein [Salipaludibacillus daqingensis]|uniref:hypothetical protein n=1 Tax=Salipaludibacillus daqingensis TaxID=3041001 RepID=UPI0024736E4A|nr:hypothetical protein [Salipaludibacillus daqingensis]